MMTMSVGGGKEVVGMTGRKINKEPAHHSKNEKFFL